jgi:RNA polymerase sigma-70 factor (ECF subfamily)
LSSGTERTDGELAVLASEGDENAFRKILDRYRQKVMAICMRMLKNSTEAEEAAQDSFVKIYLHLKDFDPDRGFAPWAAGIAINECRDRLRKRGRFKRRFREITDTDIDRTQIPVDISYENRKRVESVENAIQRLPEKLKEVLVMRAYADYSYEEIAGALKIRVGTVMSRLHRARERLTEMLDRSNE